MKKRIDQLLVENGLAPTRSKAQALVMAGQVFIGTEKITKSGEMVTEDAAVEVRESSPYVSRGAEKLSGATAAFGLDFANKIIADVGSSTGGFTDFALQHGAKKSYAIDVGTGQLAWRLRNDDRVVVMEKTHIKNIDSLPDPIDLWLVDVSFISLRRVLPEIERIQNTKIPIADCELLIDQHPPTINNQQLAIVALFKPQFEAGKEIVGKTKGVIKDEAIHQQLLQDFRNWCLDNNFEILGEVVSPIVGDKGNREFFFYLRY